MKGAGAAAQQGPLTATAPNFGAGVAGVGRERRASTAAYAKDFQRLIKGSRIEMIAEAGHLPQVEQPEAAANCIAAFLDQA